MPGNRPGSIPPGNFPNKPRGPVPNPIGRRNSDRSACQFGPDAHTGGVGCKLDTTAFAGSCPTCGGFFCALPAGLFVPERPQTLAFAVCRAPGFPARFTSFAQLARPGHPILPARAISSIESRGRIRSYTSCARGGGQKPCLVASSSSTSPFSSHVLLPESPSAVRCGNPPLQSTTCMTYNPSKHSTSGILSRLRIRTKGSFFPTSGCGGTVAGNGRRSAIRP